VLEIERAGGIAGPGSGKHNAFCCAIDRDAKVR
jgi:hypothetical protein